MDNLERTRSLIDQAMTLFDQADDLERVSRSGEEVQMHGRTYRGNELLSIVEDARTAASLPMFAAVAINLERIATAMEAIAEAGADDGRSLKAYSTAELSVELTDRLQAEADPAARHR